MNIPKQLSDIKLYHLELLTGLDFEDNKDRRLNEIAVICDTTLDELYNLSIKELQDVISEVEWFFLLTPEDVEMKFEFDVDGEKFELAKSYNDLTGGQFIDLNYYIENNKHNHWTVTKYMMAICSKSDKNNIVGSLDELNRRVKIIENLGLDIVYGYATYFIEKKKSLNNLSTVISTITVQQSSQDSGHNITESGVGQGFFMSIVGEIFLGLMICLGWVYQTFFLHLPIQMKQIKLKIKSIITSITNINKSL